MVTTLESQMASLREKNDDLLQKTMTCAVAMKAARAFVYMRHGKPGAGHEVDEQARVLLDHLEDSMKLLQDDAAERKRERQMREFERLKTVLARDEVSPG